MDWETVKDEIATPVCALARNDRERGNITGRGGEDVTDTGQPGTNCHRAVPGGPSDNAISVGVKAVELAIGAVYRILTQEQADVKTLKELTAVLKELTALMLSLEKQAAPQQEVLQVVFAAGEEAWNQ